MMTCNQSCFFTSHQQHVPGKCSQQSRVLWPFVREQRGSRRHDPEHVCKLHSSAFRCPANGCVAAPTVQERLVDGMQSSSAVSPAVRMITQLLGSLVAPAAAVALAGVLLFECPIGIADAKTRLTVDEQLTVDLFKRNTPSVVFITNLAVRRDAFTLDMMEIPQGAGSGFIWDTDGHVVTNFHVIKGASDLQVTLTDGDEYAAEVVGFDGDRDVAVLQLKMPDTVNKQEKLHPVKLGTSEDLLVGQRVYAIGNPFGLDHTLTTGVISGTGREISSGNTGRPIENVIQTDAAINPGNSGGPLLNSSGELIGVNTAIYSPSGANSGVGFAVPVDIINSSVTQIIKFGKVIRPILGISFAPDQSIEQLQLGVQGILVLDARESGPAGKAGVHGTKRDQNGRLVLGDIITGFNSMRVRNASDLYKALDKCGIGDEVDLEVLRDNDKMHIKITLGASS